MPSHTFLRGLTTFVANATHPLLNGSFNASEQNESLFSASNATSAIPDLSATADTYGDIGFIKYVPEGTEALLCVGLLYTYIHFYIGTPRQIWLGWLQYKKDQKMIEEQQNPVIVIGLLDDVSSVGSRRSIQSIDMSEIQPTV